MMLGGDEKTLNTLFDQLGLDSDDAAIEQFIEQNQLPQTVKLVDAPFWTDNQRKFLQEEFRADAGWIEVIDDLNVRLHKDAQDQENGKI